MRPAFDARPVPVQMTPVRAIVTAWRCGSKLILRVDQRDAIIKATGVGDGRPGGGDPTLGASEVQRIPSANNGDSVGRPGSMLGKGSCVIVVHEDEVRAAYGSSATVLLSSSYMVEVLLCVFAGSA